MIRTFGLKTDFAPISIVNNTYKISWDYQDAKDPIMIENGVDEEGNPKMEPSGEYIDTDYAFWVSKKFYQKPSIEYLKNIILDYYDKETDNKILSGFKWNNMPVWLSTENQFNYKAAYDLAVQTEGTSLPVTFKFGDRLNPVYYTFESLEDFTAFYTSAISYINNCLAEGWQKKDSINWNDYQIQEVE